MRRLPAALALCLGLAGSLPGQARANLIYVLNSGDASISLVDSTTREEVRRIPVLAGGAPPVADAGPQRVDDRRIRAPMN